MARTSSRINRWVVASIAALALLVGISLVVAPTANAAGSYGTNDYPDAGAVCTATGKVSGACPGYDWSGVSERHFYKRNCTDFVAWRLGITWASLAFPGGDGNARGWKQGAINSGYQTSTTPIVGAVAWWGTSIGGGFGHVAVVTAVNSDGSAKVEEYNENGMGTYSNGRNVRAEAYLYIGVSPTQPPPNPATTELPNYQLAFQASDNRLWVAGPDSRTLSYGMMSGTSPAITRLSSGNYQTAFQANDGRLWVAGPDTRALPYGMKPGTSPAIAALAGGGYQVAFQASDGRLWLAGADTRGLPYGMKPGTSPAITALPGGGYQVAFQGSDGALWSVGSAESRRLPYGMMAGTNPAITAVRSGGYQMAFQANDGRLWVAGPDTRALPYGMKPGTSPAITALPSGGYQMAFQGSDGRLWVAGPDTRALSYGMKPGTSPTITAIAGGYQVAFQGSNGSLWSVGAAGSRDLGYGIDDGSSPAITAVP
jgi:surface antigen